MRTPVAVDVSLDRRPSRPALFVLLGLGAAALLGALAILANAALLSVAACAAPAPERFVLTGSRVELCDLAGSVRLVAGTGDRTEVLVTRGGRDADRLRVESKEENGRASLRVLYPGNRVVYPALGPGSHTSLGVSGDGCFGRLGRLGLTTRRVTIAGSGPGLEAWADIEVRVPPGRDLTLQLGVGQASVADVDGKLRLNLAAAPARAERTRGQLFVDTGSGEVTLRACQGDLTVDTGSGAVRLEDLRGERLNVDTGSGAVTGARIASVGLVVDTGSGAIALEGVRASEIRLDTGSGGVRLALESGPNTLTVDTGSGGVDIVGPAELGATVKLESSSGRIDSDYTMTLVHRESETLEGRIGDGHGQIVVSTGSGSVSLKQQQ